MGRDSRKEYWLVDLPKESDPLKALDQFAEDQGLISRSDASRIILIAWAQSRQGGQNTAPMQQVQPQPSQGQGQFERRRPLNGNASAVELD